MPSSETSADPKAKVLPSLDPSRPLSQQTGTISKLIEALPDTKKEEAATDKKEASLEPSKAAESETPTGAQKPEDEPEETPFLDDDEDDDLPVVSLPEGTWQQYVYTNLPELTAHLVIDEKNKSLKVKTIDELPTNYSWQSEALRDRFMAQYQSQAILAERLKDQFENQALRARQQDFNARQAEDVAADVEWLQQHKIMPEFKYDSEDAKFNADPAVKEANEIYGLWEKTNEAYAKRSSNPSRPAYRVSYRDVAYRFYMEKRSRPTETPAKTPIQREREEVAKKQGAPQGGEADSGRWRPTSGTSMDDIKRAYRLGRI